MSSVSKNLVFVTRAMSSALMRRAGRRGSDWIRGALFTGAVGIGSCTCATAYLVSTHQYDRPTNIVYATPYKPLKYVHCISIFRSNLAFWISSLCVLFVMFVTDVLATVFGVHYPSWLRKLAQTNPWLVSPARTIERMYNDPAIEGYGPILAANVAVFLGWRFTGAGPLSRVMEKYFLLNPTRFVPSSLLLSSFSHQTPLHLGFNMYALWSFGSIMQSAVHTADFLALYATAGTFAGFTSLTASQILGRTIPSLGASGAVFFVASWVCTT